jgi:hypothetical protein
VTVADLETVRRALVRVCGAVIAARDELGRLDATAGDGDLGATLSLGFEAVQALLEEATFDDLGEMLGTVGRELGRRAPSTMGTLLGSSLRRASHGLAGRTELDAAGFAGLIEGMTGLVGDLGGATEGQRSVLDAMGPAARAARNAANSGDDMGATARAAAVAATAGVAATADMEARVGRAAWVGGRAAGSPDAGATAWALILTAFADAMADGTV